MKKILSFIIAVALLINIAVIPHASAAEFLTGNYKFMDTCYSPELGVYLALAKDLTDSANEPAQIYTSANGVEWTPTLKANSKHYALNSTRQNVVWWEAQHMFVAVMLNRLYTSQDGYEWNAVPSSVFGKSNNMIETNGRQLAIVSKASVNVYEDLELLPVATYGIDKTPNNNTYGKAIAITPNEPYMYAVTDQYKLWMFDSLKEVNPEETKSDASSQRTENIGAHPFEMAWAEGFGGWITINGTSVLRVTANSETASYKTFSNMKLEGGIDNTESFTAATADSDNVVIGSKSGKFLIAPNDSASMTVDVLWTIAKSGNNSECSEEIRSITPIGNGDFLAVSESKIMILTQENGTWRFYDVSNDNIVLENTRFEIPASGMFSEVLEPVHYDYKGEISADEIVSFELMSDLPDGVTSGNINDASAVIMIDSSASGGHQLRYRATTRKGTQKDFVVTIVDEDYVEITGDNQIVQTVAGEEEQKIEYLADVIGTDGQKMSRKAILEVTSMPEGAKFDSSSNTFTIDENTQAGEIVITAYSETTPSNKAEKRVMISARRPVRIELAKAQESLFIPDNEEQKFEYAAVLYDQIDREMNNEKIDWSIEGKEIDSMDGISINKDTGELTVLNTAVKGVVTIKAAAQRNTEIFAETDVMLNYTDLRIVREDFSEFELDTSKPITENLVLATVGTLGSTVKWRSTDENIVGTDGTIIRPSREDKKITITGVWKKDTESFEQKYELTVKKADNLCVNGDLSDGTTDGWIPKNDTELTIVKDGEKNILSAKGTGAYQKFIFTNDSSYGIEARVKASSGSKIRIVSEKGGTLAEITAGGGYQDIKTSYDYRKQKNSFEDKIYIECSGTLMIEKLVVYEITLELNEVSEAVNKAVYSKAQTDINAAGALLTKFYDLPVRSELYKKLNAINAGSTSSGSGGGGASGGASKSDTAPGSVITDKTENSIPAFADKVNDNTADELDTYLLRFKDMKNHWARKDVEYMAEIGIVNGDENDMFRPDDKVSRAEFAAIISRAMGLEETEYENSFFDIVKDDWYSGYVQTVRSNNYMNGYDGLFNPDSAITREEIAKVIVAAYNGKTNTKLKTGLALYFNDIDDISDWAYDYIVEAADMGFIYGITEELFAPKQLATRAEAAVMIKRVYAKLNPSG